MNYADVSNHVNEVNGFMGSISQREFMFNLGKVTENAAEIGSWKGLSAVIVLLGMRSVCRETIPKYYCIDTFEASNEELNSESTFEEFSKATGKFDDLKIIQPIKGWSTDLKTLEQIPNNLDWVYIDGDHSTEAVYNDIILYHPKIKTNGLILFHDHTWETVKAGIDKAAEEKLIELVCFFDDFGVYKVK